MPAGTAPRPDPADERLVADALARITASGPGDGAWTRLARSHALRRLPVAEAAQVLRLEVADALREPNPWRRPDRLFNALMDREGLPGTAGPVLTDAGHAIGGGPARILILPAPPGPAHPGGSDVDDRDP